MSKTKILVAGIGAVGGYFGGLLAKQFQESKDVEICFLTRGENFKKIKTDGLKVIKGNNHFIAVPSKVSDNPIDIGIVQYILICTKSYDLIDIATQLKPCVGQETIFLPLLNGVDGSKKILKIFPNNIVLEGCVYVVSRLIDVGIVENKGNIEKLYFGLDKIKNEKLNLLENIFKASNIDATLSWDISKIIWEKFIFISSIATATSYFNDSIGLILSNKSKKEILISLINEVKAVAKIKQIKVSYNIRDEVLEKLALLPFETTSSMHSDFQNKQNKTELNSLTEYVVKEAENHNIATPTFKMILIELQKK